MSIGYGPRVVTDGLLLALDAADINSYAGSGTTWNDISGKGNTLTATSTPTFSSSGGGSIEFDGTDDLYTINNTFVGSDQIATTEANGNYTLEAWINVHTSQGTTTSADSIIGSTSNYGVGMQVGVFNGNPRMNYGARFTSNFYGSEFSYNTWTHVCLSRIGGTSVRAYLNGNFDNDTNVNSLEVPNGQTIGNMTIGNSSPRVTGFYDGLIAVVRIYNIGLSDDQVKQNFNALRGRFGI
tara:strand:- start:258 stop:974 length:717 start_codon:yes stop_codon:yes gene_type:complete